MRPLGLITGEISTGKTSVLQFIAYCLGRNRFPNHLEIRRSVTNALVEVELGGSVFVIERTAVERPSRTATVHSCSIEELASPHRTEELEVGSATGPGSLSHFLLADLGIAEIRLKEAPTQSASGVDRLSIRDLLRLVFVRYEDLGQEHLLRENQPPVRLKFEQVIDVLFGAHDNRAASVAAEMQRIRTEIQKHERELSTILAFMAEQHVPAEDVLGSELDELGAELEQRNAELAELEDEMSAVADFGQQQRLTHQEAARRASSALNRQRTVATQIERLTSLAAQYDQDVKKLTFAEAAGSLFDPLLVSVCPWCFQKVEAGMDESGCGVCNQALPGDAHTADSGADISRELRAVRKRRNELADYLTELHEEAHQATLDHRGAEDAARHAESALDEAMQGRFAPFIDQRDALVGAVTKLTSDIASRGRLLAMHASAGRRRAALAGLRQDLEEQSEALADAEQTTTTRADALLALNNRYASILEDFRFPKLSDPVIDSRYVPFARQQRYNELGSAGGRTLVTLAWYLAIFELAVEAGGPHPGILMIDSPQKGLKPTAGEERDEFQDPSIAASVYERLIGWAESAAGTTAQIIVVDNLPQASANEMVIVDYSADESQPPYGLIDDAVD
ncbi:MAG: hypothetical protein AAGA37_13710 [Actinomycetota bacterium]